MRRYFVLGIALVVVASSCAWARPRFDAGRSGHNPQENRINAANVATLTRSYATAADPSARGFVVSRGHIYVTGSPMRVFDAGGQQGCSGTPRVCAPQWSLDGPGVADVLDTSVYGPSNNGAAAGYDADGEMRCSGTPKICSPLWNETIALPTSGSLDPDRTHFEVVRQSARGSESAKIFGYNIRCVEICVPVWAGVLGTGPNGGIVAEPAVRDGVLFAAYAPVGANGTLHAFDATHGFVASELWTASLDGVNSTEIAVADGIVVVPVQTTLGTKLEAFDAKGVAGCSGTPKVCTPIWSTDVVAVGADAAPAIANGVVYRAVGSQIRAYDAHGTIGCGGTPKVCEKLWVSFVGPNISAPAVANGLVYVTSSDGSVEAFDAAGLNQCSATTRVCAALWTVTLVGGAGDVEVANGRVFVASANGAVTAFALPVAP